MYTFEVFFSTIFLKASILFACVSKFAAFLLLETKLFITSTQLEKLGCLSAVLVPWLDFSFFFPFLLFLTSFCSLVFLAFRFGKLVPSNNLVLFYFLLLLFLLRQFSFLPLSLFLWFLIRFNGLSRIPFRLQFFYLGFGLRFYIFRYKAERLLDANIAKSFVSSLLICYQLMTDSHVPVASDRAEL